MRKINNKLNIQKIMRYTKSIFGFSLIGIILLILVVEVLPEIQRVSDQQAKIEARNAEIRAEKTASFNIDEQYYGKLPTVKQCENINSSSLPELRDKCVIVWSRLP